MVTLLGGDNHRIMSSPLACLGIIACSEAGRSQLTFGSLVWCWGLSHNPSIMLSHNPSMEGSVPLAIFSHKKLCYSAQRDRTVDCAACSTDKETVACSVLKKPPKIRTIEEPGQPEQDLGGVQGA